MESLDNQLEQQKRDVEGGKAFKIGEIVWAKVKGFPWWPAKVGKLTNLDLGDHGFKLQNES